MGKADQRRLAAIMFTDIVGYASMVQRDESRALTLLEIHRRMVRSAVSKYGGTEVKTMGDGFLIEFSSALQAVRCAIEIQSVLARRNSKAPGDERILIRIGLHVGDILRRGDDILGDGVNIASRIEPMAEPGGICISQQVFDQIRNKIGNRVIEVGTRELKHIDAPMKVYRIDTGREATRVPHGTEGRGSHRIAVLPLANISPDKSDEYFAEGMTEELISTLTRVAGLNVIARTSVMKYKGGGKSIAEIGQELNVPSIVEGSVRKVGDKVRITVQLVDSRNEEELWSQGYDRDLADIFAIQSDVAQQVASSLRLEVLHGGERGAVERKVTRDTGAYTLYLRGRYFSNRRNEESLQKAIQFFRQALRRDPKYALAMTGLADAHASMALLELAPPRETFPDAKAAVLKALRIDPSLAEAHTSLGLIRFQYDRSWDASEAEFIKAIGLNPGYAQAHHYFADYLKAMGRFDEALNEVKRAQELDPLSIPVNTGLGHVLYLSRRYDAAIEQYRRTVELDPNDVLAHLWFGRPYLQKGMFNDAISEIRKAVEISGGSTISLAVLGHACASAGDTNEAQRIIRVLQERAKKKYVPSYWMALIYVGLQDKDSAFAWLNRAYAERSSWLAWVGVEPRFDGLRTDRRFVSLLTKLRLTQFT